MKQNEHIGNINFCYERVASDFTGRGTLGLTF